MKVVIFCGGEGTRLKEETEYKPKPLVEVGGMPILWHIMKIYSAFGHKEFILPLGFKGELIKQFFVEFPWRANDFTLKFKEQKIQVHKNHKNEDWVIHFIDTGRTTMTALRLKKVEHLFNPGEDFMLTYGDGVADIDINKLIEFHKKEKRLATITGVNVSSRFGIIATQDTKLESFKEKPMDDNYINGGFMVLNQEIFNHLSEDNIMLESEEGPLSTLAKKGQVSVYHHGGFWHCMDTYRDYLSLNKLWKDKPKWKIW